MKRNARHWIRMKTLFFVLLTLFSAHIAAQQSSVQVVNIFEDGTLEAITSAGFRQKIRLAGIQTITFPNQIKSATAKRLKTLVLGKTVQLNTLENQLLSQDTSEEFGESQSQSCDELLKLNLFSCDLSGTTQ